MTTEGLRVLVLRAAYAIALIAAVAWAYLLLSVSAGNGTLGYDFKAYDLAVDRLLAGQSMYDQTATSMGAFGLFFYPPPFALLVLPWALLPQGLDVLVWTATLIAATIAAIALMPVSLRVRLAIGLLAAFSWPLVYAIKLGQVGPILFLLFALGWRALDRPAPLGATIGLGTLVKVQPGLLVLWAAFTGRWRAIGVAAAVAIGVSLVAVVVGGLQAWLEYPTLLGRVASPLTTPHNFTPGAVAYQSGASLEVAGAIQAGAIVLALATVVIAARRSTADAAYLVTVVASQLTSPLLWDHYAMLLLLPVAWLLDRGAWWAVLVPLATSILAIGIAPAAVYPVVFAVSLVAPLVLGWRRNGAAAAAGTRRAGAAA